MSAILVTGATNGIGLSLTKSLLDKQFNVVGIGRDQDSLNNLSTEYGSLFTPLRIDLSDKDNYNDIADLLPTLSGIVFAAGVVKQSPISYFDEDLHSCMMEVNINSPIFILSRILRRKKLSKGSSIVFISSINGGYKGFNGSVSYASSKAAMLGAVKVLASELARKKIRVNAVSPAGIDIGMMRDEFIMRTLSQEALKAELNTYLLTKAYLPPSSVVEPIEFLLSNASSSITGQNIVICGGASLY